MQSVMKAIKKYDRNLRDIQGTLLEREELNWNKDETVHQELRYTFGTRMQRLHISIQIREST